MEESGSVYISLKIFLDGVEIRQGVVRNTEVKFSLIRILVSILELMETQCNFINGLAFVKYQVKEKKKRK